MRRASNGEKIFPLSSKIFVTILKFGKTLRSDVVLLLEAAFFVN